MGSATPLYYDVIQGATGLAGATNKVLISSTAPSNPVEGDMYFNTGMNTLMIRVGTSWVVASPQSPGES